MESGDGEAKIKANANNNVEEKMDMDESMADGHVEIFLTREPKTWTVASGNQCETQERDGGSKEEKDQDKTDNDFGPKMARASNDHREGSSIFVPETSVVASKSQHETEETEGGCEEGKDEAGVYDEKTQRSTTMEGDGQAS